MRRRKQKLNIGRLAAAAGAGAVLGAVVVPKLEQHAFALKDRLKHGHPDKKRDKGHPAAEDSHERTDSMIYGDNILRTLSMYYPRGTKYPPEAL